MQYVLLTYMKHLGVKVKEPRGLEQKRARINFLPKMKVRSLDLLYRFHVEALAHMLLMILQSV